jgi:hypothetical protein
MPVRANVLYLYYSVTCPFHENTYIPYERTRSCVNNCFSSFDDPSLCVCVCDRETLLPLYHTTRIIVDSSDRPASLLPHKVFPLPILPIFKTRLFPSCWKGLDTDEIGDQLRDTSKIASFRRLTLHIHPSRYLLGPPPSYHRKARLDKLSAIR